MNSKKNIQQFLFITAILYHKKALLTYTQGQFSLAFSLAQKLAFECRENAISGNFLELQITSNLFCPDFTIAKILSVKSTGCYLNCRHWISHSCMVKGQGDSCIAGRKEALKGVTYLNIYLNTYSFNFHITEAHQLC